MTRVSVAAVAALAIFSGSASACEFHEMMSFYGAPQRYSAFARVEQSPAEPAPQAMDQGTAEQSEQAAAEDRVAQAEQLDQTANAQERARVRESERATNVLAQRR